MYTAFIAKNVAAHSRWATDLRPIASPSKMRIAPEIIGFRTYPYGPDTTSSRGGSHGAKVPRPSRATRLSDEANNTKPIAITRSPASCTARFAGFEASPTTVSLLREIHKGTTT